MSSDYTENGPSIGIDLGTTFSCISVYKEGRAELIVDNNGDRLIPSIVYYDPYSGKVSVGKDALDEEPNCYGNCIRDVKRIIGRRFNDEFIKNYIKKEDIAFKLVQGNNFEAVFEIEINDNVVTKTPEEVSAEILKYLKEMAKNYLDQDVSKVVITVPAYFSNAQRKSTQEAAKLAGLDVIRLVTEPSAAGSHYLRDKTFNGKVLVFDWGGGTLDISYIQVKKKILDVKAVYGDTQLGGRDLDDILFEHFKKPSMSDDSSKTLLQKCIDLKKKLSKTEQAKINVPNFNERKNFELSIFRGFFETLAADIFDKAMKLVEYGLFDVGWNKFEIDMIILVGGTTRIPKIRSLLKKFFFDKELKTDLNPDEAVAAGASLQAYRLQNFEEYLENFKISEVTPLSLGFSADEDFMNFVIFRNSPLPAKRTVQVETTWNYQEEAKFEIYEGERKICNLNNKFGELIISGLPLKRAGEVQFDVTFHLDTDGILTITANELLSGKTEKLIVTMGECRLSEKKIKVSIEESIKKKCEDDDFEDFVKLKWKVKANCRHIQYDLDKITVNADNIIVEEGCLRFLKQIEACKFREKFKLEAALEEFKLRTYYVLKKYNMEHIFND